MRNRLDDGRGIGRAETEPRTVRTGKQWRRNPPTMERLRGLGRHEGKALRQQARGPGRETGLRGRFPVSPEEEALARRYEELGYGQEEEALAFLGCDPVRHLRIIWALRNWGLFNLGMPEQGHYLAARGERGIEGILFLGNLGLWRLAARGDTARGLAEEALGRWGIPEVLAGTEDEVESLLHGVDALAKRIAYREREVSLALNADDFRPRPGGARLAREEDIGDLVELEGMMQEELMGSRAAAWVIRSQITRAVERGLAALVEREGKVVAKAAIEASTPGADELGGVYAVPAWRRRGLASAACTLLCESSLARGKKVRLETQRDNRAARRFYDGLGFRLLWPHLAVRFRVPG